MKTIGFVDFFIDEWHANNYPQWIRESSLKAEFNLAWAWAEKDREGGVTTDAWCEKFRVRKAASMERLLADCDAIVILSPDNPERHEDLSRLAAGCKKPVYIDKTFAPDLAAARRIFSNFEKGGTPMFSSSALRFAEEFEALAAKGIARGAAKSVTTRGPGQMARYGIHQVEMIVSLMGAGMKRVMQTGPEGAPHFVFEWHDGRRAQMTLLDGLPFQLAVRGEAAFVANEVKGVFFPRFIEAMLAFFKDPSKSPAPKGETLQIIAAIESGVKALSKPDEWIELPKV